MLQRRLHDQILALRETAFDLPNDAGLTQVLKLLGDAENEEKERIRERLQRSLPERRSIENPPSTINEKIAMMMGAFRK